MLRYGYRFIELCEEVDVDVVDAARNSAYSPPTGGILPELFSNDLVDADALAIINSMWKLLPKDLRSFVASSCHDGQEIDAAITILDYSLVAKLPVPVDTLNLARGLAHKLTHEADIRRINALVLELRKVQSTTKS